VSFKLEEHGVAVLGGLHLLYVVKRVRNERAVGLFLAPGGAGQHEVLPYHVTEFGREHRSRRVSSQFRMQCHEKRLESAVGLRQNQADGIGHGSFHRVSYRLVVGLGPEHSLFLHRRLDCGEEETLIPVVSLGDSELAVYVVHVALQLRELQLDAGCCGGVRLVSGDGQQGLLGFLRCSGKREVLYLAVQLRDARLDIACFANIGIVLCGDRRVHGVQGVGIKARGADAVRPVFKEKLVEVLVVLSDSTRYTREDRHAGEDDGLGVFIYTNPAGVQCVWAKERGCWKTVDECGELHKNRFYKVYS